MYSIMASVSNESCASSFPIWVPFISFSSLIAVAKTSRTMLNNNGKEGTLVLILILGGCFQIFNIENNVCCRLIMYTFTMLR